MVATPKYKAKAVYYDSIRRVVIGMDEVENYRVKGRLKLPKHFARFDSQHEFGVYLELCRLYGEDRIIRQYPVEIFPPGLCYPKGRTWRIDFAITHLEYKGVVRHFVEAKGAFLPEFALTLAIVERYQPEVFNMLWLVFSSQIPANSRILVSLANSNYLYRLLTLERLKCLSHLPLPL